LGSKVKEATVSPESRDPDLPLLEAFRRGEAGAFDDLVRRHEGRVHRLAYRMLGDADAALDAAQEAFVRAWKALPRFQGASRFSTWITRIVINQCRNELRRRRTVKHTQPLSLDAPSSDSETTIGAGVAAPGAEPWEAVRAREVARALESCLQDLDEESREVLVLRDAEDLSYEEVAEILEVPVGTLRSRLHRARSDLRRRMGGVLEDRPK
jgi:RNA polymerase sigma-70 factor (ECF subfamily)